MKALVYTGAASLVYRDVADPIPAENESLVRIEAAGICGSDLHVYHGQDLRRRPPLILGHELAGTVLDGSLTGQTVAINPLISCRQCNQCLSGHPNLCGSRKLVGLDFPGGFAEYITVESVNLFPLANNFNLINASLMEPTAVSVHAIMLAEKALNRPISECSSLVIGGGAIGVLTALILKHKGVSELMIAETNSSRRQSLRTISCGDVFNPQDKQLPDNNHFDVVFDAVGNGQSRAAASCMVTAGGVISHIGLQDSEPGLDVRRLTLQEIKFIGSYIYNPIDLQIALRLLGGGELGSLDWTESRPLSDGANAFHALHTGVASSPKIILQPARG